MRVSRELSTGPKFGLALDERVYVALGDGGGRAPPERRQRQRGYRQSAAGLNGRDGCLSATIGRKETVVDEVQNLGGVQRYGFEGKRTSARAADRSKGQGKPHFCAPGGPQGGFINGVRVLRRECDGTPAGKQCTDHRMS